MNFPEAIATVGIAFAIAGAFIGFFYLLVTTGGLNDYEQCLNGCHDGWGKFENLECPEMCLQLSEDYKCPKQQIEIQNATNS